MNPLLQWGLSNSSPEALREMAEGKREAPTVDRKWMDIMLKSDADKMKDQLKIVADKSKAPEEVAAALEELEYLVQSIDNANDLHKVNGFDTVLDSLAHEDPEVQANAAWVLATGASNNPEFQKLFLEKDGMKKTVSVMSSTSEEIVLSKCVFLVTTCISNNQVALAAFKELNGFPVLMNSVKTSKIGTQRKIVHLLHRMASTHHSVKDTINEYAIFVDLVALLQIDDLDLREKVLHALIEFAHGHANNLRDYKAKGVTGPVEKLHQSLDKDAEHNAELLKATSALLKLLR